VVTQYTDDELRLIVEFYDQMEQVIRAHLARLRAPAAAPGTAGPAEPTGPADPAG
jgi:hypothetical protein